VEVGKKVKNKKIKFYFYSKTPLLDVGGFAKQGIKKYSPKPANSGLQREGPV
jgi:hypothetical protein